METRFFRSFISQKTIRYHHHHHHHHHHWHQDAFSNQKPFWFHVNAVEKMAKGLLYLYKQQMDG